MSFFLPGNLSRYSPAFLMSFVSGKAFSAAEIASSTVFLLTSKASFYVTGENILDDGD